jgi:CRP/FNR family transcriptional regulator, cyclic AMP receptor protein
MSTPRPAHLSYEDPLTYLPRKPIQGLGKGRVVYGPRNPPISLYVVIFGRVKITTTAPDGCQTIGRIVCAEGLFGESSLVGGGLSSESAVALDDVNLMSWTREEIEQYVEREPRLGVALAQYFMRRCLELEERIESMAVYKIPERILLALAQLADTLGVATSDGAIRIDSLTHQAVAEYVGTSREIITFQMNRLRREGIIRYSRRYIDVLPQALPEWVRHRRAAIAVTTGG